MVFFCADRTFWKFNLEILSILSRPQNQRNNDNITPENLRQKCVMSPQKIVNLCLFLCVMELFPHNLRIQMFYDLLKKNELSVHRFKQDHSKFCSPVSPSVHPAVPASPYKDTSLPTSTCPVLVAAPMATAVCQSSCWPICACASSVR